MHPRLQNFFSSISFTLLILLASCSEESEKPPPPPYKENWYGVSEIENNTWAFEESKSSQHNVSYLIAGSQRAIMFDAGTGENRGQDGSRIRYTIEEKTDLPVTLILSHFHFDHNQNIDEFDKVAFPDLDFLKSRVNEENTYTFRDEDLLIGIHPVSTEVDEWLPLATDINLGDRLIQVVNLPGHTDESVVIIDHKNKLVFTGDFLYNGTLFTFRADDIKRYAESIEVLIAMIDDDYRLFGAHSAPLVPYQHMLNLLSLLECIVESNCYTETPAIVLGIPGTTYKSLDGGTSLLLLDGEG